MKRRSLIRAHRDTRQLLKAGWGDDESGGGPLNPYYDPELYGEYDLSVRRNLARVDEDRVRRSAGLTDDTACRAWIGGCHAVAGTAALPSSCVT